VSISARIALKSDAAAADNTIDPLYFAAESFAAAGTGTAPAPGAGVR